MYIKYSGCSAARLARVVRDDEVGSSNLPTPTSTINYFGELRVVLNLTINSSTYMQ